MDETFVVAALSGIGALLGFVGVVQSQAKNLVAWGLMAVSVGVFIWVL